MRQKATPVPTLVVILLELIQVRDHQPGHVLQVLGGLDGMPFGAINEGDLLGICIDQFQPELKAVACGAESDGQFEERALFLDRHNLHPHQVVGGTAVWGGPEALGSFLYGDSECLSEGAGDPIPEGVAGLAADQNLRVHRFDMDCPARVICCPAPPGGPESGAHDAWFSTEPGCPCRLRGDGLNPAEGTATYD